MSFARTLGALAVVVAFSSGLFACKAKDDAGQGAQTAPSAQTPRVTVNEDGFVPDKITLQQGTSGKIEFFRTTDETCATEVVFPDLGLKKDLPIATAVVVEVPTNAARTLTFECGMGMYKSSVVVH